MRIKLAGEGANIGDTGITDTHLVGRRKEKRQLGRPWRKWNGKMKMDPKEVGLMDSACFQLA
jgi:hypothetical protein